MTRRSAVSRASALIVAALSSTVFCRRAAAAQSPVPNLTPLDGGLPPTLLNLLSTATDTDTPFSTLCAAKATILSNTAVQSEATTDSGLAAALTALSNLLNIDPSAAIAEPIIIV